MTLELTWVSPFIGSGLGYGSRVFLICLGILLTHWHLRKTQSIVTVCPDFQLQPPFCSICYSPPTHTHTPTQIKDEVGEETIYVPSLRMRNPAASHFPIPSSQVQNCGENKIASCECWAPTNRVQRLPLKLCLTQRERDEKFQPSTLHAPITLTLYD